MPLKSLLNPNNKEPSKKITLMLGLKSNKKKRKRNSKDCNNKNLLSLTKRLYKKQKESNRKDWKDNRCLKNKV